MVKNHQNTNKSLKDPFKERARLMKPFVKRFGKPVIVHGLSNEQSFEKILKQGILDLPKKHKSEREKKYVEKYLGIDNAIYLSLGFVYATSYNLKYNFVFKIDFIKQLQYYNQHLVFQTCKAIVGYWHDNDKNYLDKLESKNDITKEVMKIYYTPDSNGNIGSMFQFWRVGKELLEHIDNYKNKKTLLKIINDTQNKYLVKYPKSMKLAVKDSPHGISSEMVSLKKINLKNNPDFIGFYIPNEINPEIIRLLRKYHGKLVFDGKTFKTIKS